MDKNALDGLISLLDNWAAFFTLLVVIGVGGELVIHIMSSRANKKLIALQSIESLAQEAEIARMKKDSAGFELDIAKANKGSSEAKKSAAEANAKAEGFRLDIAKANKSVAQAQARVATATAEAAKANLEVAKLKTPRSLINLPQIVDSPKPYSGIEYVWAGVCAEKECTDFLKNIDAALQQAGWKRLRSIGTYPALIVFSDDPGGITTTLAEGIGIAVEAQNSSQLIAAQDLLHSPRHLQAAAVLNFVLAANTYPPEQLDKKPGKILETREGISNTVWITVGKKVVY